MKRHLELEIKTLQNAPRDADKLRRLLKINQRQKEEAEHIEDTERLVTEIEMLKVVLFLVCRNREEEQAKSGYWQNELYSLGISEPNRKRKEELNDNKAELEKLADIIKEALFEDYKLAYSEEGETHK